MDPCGTPIDTGKKEDMLLLTESSVASGLATVSCDLSSGPVPNMLLLHTVTCDFSDKYDINQSSSHPLIPYFSSLNNSIL